MERALTDLVRSRATPSQPASSAGDRLESLALCIPVYDEVDSIQHVVDAAVEAGHRVADAIEIVIVDDGSTDGTGELVDLLAERARVRAVHHDRNRGYGAALRSAINASDSAWVLLTDGDGQFDLGELEDLVRLSSGADIVAGYRAVRADPVFRHLNAWLYSLFLRTLFGLRVRDVDCAFKLVRRSVLDAIDLSSNGAFISAELLIRASRAGFRLTQHGVSHHPRRAGRATGADPKVVLKMFPEAWRLWRELDSRRP